MIETDRVMQKIAKEGGFREHVFSSTEIAYCEKQAKQAEHYAARFAAKEALLKALGTGLAGDLVLNEIHLVHDAAGKPSFRFSGESERLMKEKNILQIHVSLSHLQHIAGAVVVIEQSPE